MGIIIMSWSGVASSASTGRRPMAARPITNIEQQNAHWIEKELASKIVGLSRINAQGNEQKEILMVCQSIQRSQSIQIYLKSPIS
jgi:hypothetical protein